MSDFAAMSDQKYVIRKKFRRGDIEITMSPEAYKIFEDHFREN